MGNCCKSCKLYRKPARNITLVITGLDNAGKTTVGKRLVGEPVDSVLKTLGFSLIVLNYHGVRVSMYDLGGCAQIRDIWNKYFMDAHGVLFVVDASDVIRLAEAKSTLATVISHENISGKPVLLLANKQDKENALDELELVEQLDVEFIVNKYRCLTRVEICSALAYEHGKIDFGIRNGFRWLIDNVLENYKTLNERVEHDMTNYAIQVQKNMDEWRSRVKAKNNAEYSDEDQLRNGNPFQPINQLFKTTNARSCREEDIKLHNGAAARTILVDNYVQNECNPRLINEISDFTEKTETQRTQRSTMDAMMETFKKNTSKLNQQYHRHKKKFSRFNKTAPMPIDVIMRGESSDMKPSREISKYSVKSNRVYGDEKIFENYHKNYLSRRPATAPSKFHFSTIKVDAAWNLQAPPALSTTFGSRVMFLNHKDSDSEDVVSFF